LIRIGGTVSAFGFAAVFLGASVPGLWAACFVSASGMGCIVPAFSAMAANAARPHEQGTAAGTLGAAQGLGMVVGSLLSGMLFHAVAGVPCLVCAALLLLVALWPFLSAVRQHD
jgi:MFS family permease